MKRKPTIATFVILLGGLASIVVWWIAQEPDDGSDVRPPEDELPELEVAEVVPGTDTPELWGPDELGATSCEVETWVKPTSRARTESPGLASISELRATSASAALCFFLRRFASAVMSS